MTDAQDETETVDNGEEPEAAPEEVLTPADFKLLKDMLPATADGMPRKQAVGSSESNSSSAMGNYEDVTGKKIVLISITDNASNSAPSGESDMEVENEKVSSTAQNVKVQGYPAYEMYTQEKGGDGTGSVHINVKNHFRVDIQTTLISQEEIRKVAESMDLGRLAAMK